MSKENLDTTHSLTSTDGNLFPQPTGGAYESELLPTQETDPFIDNITLPNRKSEIKTDGVAAPSTGDRNHHKYNNDVTTSQGRDPFLKYKIFKQISLILIWICLGVYLEVVGPSLPDLRDRLRVNTEEISQALVFSSIGIIIGCVGGGFLHERFYHQSELIFALALMTAAVSITIVPHVGRLSLVALCLFINGATEGFINTGGNTMVMHMWGLKAAAPMHSLHFGFGFGAIITPQIVRPFLKRRDQNRTRRMNAEEDIPIGLYSSNTTIPPSLETPQSRIEFAYMIAGICAFCCSLLWLYIYIKGPPKDFPRREGTKKLTRQMFSPASCARGDLLFGTLLLISLFVYFTQAVGGEKAFGRFIFTFLVESRLKFTNNEAVNLNSLFWVSFTLGRLTGIPLSHFVPTPIMIGIQSVGVVISSIVLAAAVFESRYIIWIFCVPLGYFAAQVFPSGMAWSNNYLDMNSVAVMVLFLGAFSGGTIYQYLPGFLLYRYGHGTFMYIIVVYAVGLLAVFIIMQILGKIFLKRIPNKYEFEGDVPEVIPMKSTNVRAENNDKNSNV